MIEFAQLHQTLLLNHATGYRVIMACFVVALFWLVRRISNRTLQQLATSKGVTPARYSFIKRCVNVALLFIAFALFSISTGIGFGDVSLFLSSIFAVLGVALVAQWSILSNVTASFLIFFSFPYRIGHQIRVIDKDEDISGEIIDISMFHVLIRHKKGHVIVYPNNLILQKGVIKLPPATKTSTRRLYTRRSK